MLKGEFPTRENCDPTNPEEAFLWMMVAPPGINGAPLLMPVEHLRDQSKRLWDCGARPVEQPVIEYRAPSGNDPHWLTSPGRWIKAGTEPQTRDEVGGALSRMPQPQKAELFTALKAWEAGEPIPDSKAGRAAEELNDEQKRVVLERLRNVST